MSRHEDELLKTIIEVSNTVAPTVLQSIAKALEDLPQHATAANRFAISGLAPHPSSRETVRQLLQLWSDSCPSVTQTSLAWALRSASAMNEHERSIQSLELVWTGPSSSSAFRRTDQALLELVNSAKKSILIVTFAAYKMPELEHTLISACKRNVEVTMVLESSQLSDGKMKFGALESFGSELIELSKVYAWPLENRERDSKGNYGSLHLKCAVADDHLALISSANLTGFAMTLNMELGIMLKGGPIPAEISTHIGHLIENKTLVSVQ